MWQGSQFYLNAPRAIACAIASSSSPLLPWPSFPSTFPDSHTLTTYLRSSHTEIYESLVPIGHPGSISEKKKEQSRHEEANKHGRKARFPILGSLNPAAQTCNSQSESAARQHAAFPPRPGGVKHADDSTKGKLAMHWRCMARRIISRLLAAANQKRLQNLQNLQTISPTGQRDPASSRRPVL